MGHIVARSIGGLLFIAVAVCGVPEARAGDPGCDNSLRDRTASQVLEAHRAALFARDWPTVACNYAPDAVTVHDGGTTVGRDAIVRDLQVVTEFFGAFFPQVNEEVIVPILRGKAEMARVLWSISTQCIDIFDGADTYFISEGKIHAQTAHGFPTFRCQP
jgi:ketosteroid isomerase-like protein